MTNKDSIYLICSVPPRHLKIVTGDVSGIRRKLHKEHISTSKTLGKTTASRLAKREDLGLTDNCYTVNSKAKSLW